MKVCNFLAPGLFFRKFAHVLLGCLILVSGNAVAADAATRPREDLVKTSDAKVSFGNYLVAEYASASRDTAAAATYYLKTLQTDPDNMLLQQKAFSALIADGRFTPALPIAGKLAEQQNTNAMPRFFLLLNEINEGRFAEARVVLENIPETGFQTLLGPLVRAWSLAGEGETANAVAALDPLDETPVFRPFRRNHKALIYTFSNDVTEAEIAYKAALVADRKGNLRIVLAYGRFLAGIDRAYEAKQLYEEYATKYPDNLAFAQAARELGLNRQQKPLVQSPGDGLAEALYGMAQALSADNAAGPAAYYLRLATFLRPDFPDAYLLLGQLLEGEGHVALAMEAYNKVSQDDILSGAAQLRKAWLLNDMDRTQDAIDLLGKLVSKNPAILEYQTSLADLLRSHEKYKDAIRYYTGALGLAPDDARDNWLIYYARGIAYERDKRWPQAEEDFLKALTLNPDQPQVLNYLGYSWVDQGLHLEKAMIMLQKAVELSPHDGFIIDSLGWAMFRLGRYDEAVELLEKAVLLQPQDPTLNDHLGDAYWASGRRNEAKFQWHHAISLGAAGDEKARIEVKLLEGIKLDKIKTDPAARLSEQ